jgi:hypothetical protein
MQAVQAWPAGVVHSTVLHPGCTRTPLFIRVPRSIRACILRPCNAPIQHQLAGLAGNVLTPARARSRRAHACIASTLWRRQGSRPWHKEIEMKELIFSSSKAITHTTPLQHVRSMHAWSPPRASYVQRSIRDAASNLRFFQQQLGPYRPWMLRTGVHIYIAG